MDVSDSGEGNERVRAMAERTEGGRLDRVALKYLEEGRSIRITY